MTTQERLRGLDNVRRRSLASLTELKRICRNLKNVRISSDPSASFMSQQLQQTTEWTVSIHLTHLQSSEILSWVCYSGVLGADWSENIWISITKRENWKVPTSFDYTACTGSLTCVDSPKRVEATCLYLYTRQEEGHRIHAYFLPCEVLFFDRGTFVSSEVRLSRHLNVCVWTNVRGSS